jgi:NIMA (never in mitosis gene a)-related kinase
MDNPYIVKYQECFIDEKNLIIIMDYCEEGDLGFHIKKMKKEENYFTEPLIMNWFIQICFALDYIHNQKKILHRDIKVSNIFLNSNGYIQIGDFGISKVL